MKKFVALYDKAAERFGNPQLVVNLEVAIRDFAVGCKEKNTPMTQFPGDISLKYLGDFNEETGIITPLKEPITIAKAEDYVKLDEPIKGTQVIENPQIKVIHEKFKSGEINKEIDKYAKNLQKEKKN